MGLIWAILWALAPAAAAFAPAATGLAPLTPDAAGRRPPASRPYPVTPSTAGKTATVPEAAAPTEARAGASLPTPSTLPVPASAARGAGDPAPRTSGDSAGLTPRTDWRPVLVDWSEHPLRGRLQWRQARLALEEGRRDQAVDTLEDALAEDPGLAEAWWTLARIHLSTANPLFLQDLVEGFKASLHGFRAQSLAAARLLIGLDLVLGASFLWILLVLSFRYLPFLHHQLASWLEHDHHAGKRAWLIWIPIAAVFSMRLGLVPIACLAFFVVWLYGGRRERVVLLVFALFFAAQGLDGGALSTPLAGVRQTSKASLSYRAAYDTPTPSLLSDLDAAIDEDPEDADLFFARGLFRAHRGDFRGSSRDFQAGLDLRPDDSKAVSNLASNHYFLGNYDRAVAGFQRSASLDSTRGLVYYNLAQAYIKKLFFKEGGEYMQRASRLGFELGSSAQRLPAGAVYYHLPSTWDSWKIAWKERSSLNPYDLLSPWSSWMGVPADHIAAWLAVTLLLSVIAMKLLSRERLVYECSNCGQLTCPRCSGEHEGSILCPRCHTTAQRARSEVVLSTLLRNRRRAAEYAFHTRARKLNAWAIGAGDLYNGVRKRGLFLTLASWACAFGILLPGGILPSPWQPPSSGILLPLPRILGIAGLLLFFLLSRYGRTSWRSRSFLLHPSSMVKFTDLLDHRAETRLKTSRG